MNSKPPAARTPATACCCSFTHVSRYLGRTPDQTDTPHYAARTNGSSSDGRAPRGTGAVKAGRTKVLVEEEPLVRRPS